jgi:trehalose utilization protein
VASGSTLDGSDEEYPMEDKPIRITVWGEYLHERQNDAVRQIYPQGMHTVIAEGISGLLGKEAVVRTATLDQSEHGLTDAVLETTDVLTWWGHLAHDQVEEIVVKKVHERVLAGMGLVVLHSGHASKIFRRLMGTTCALRWREADDREVVWTVNPSHPIAFGIAPVFVIPRHEMYGEYFDIPQPDELLFISSFSGGEVFRSGCCFRRGLGRIFYFSPGHEFYPIYYQAEIRCILANAVRWACPTHPIRPEPCKIIMSPTGWFENAEE